MEEAAAAVRRVGTERIASGRKAVSEEPQDTMVSEEDNARPQDDSALAEAPSAGEAEQADSEDSEADFEAHGSWGGIG